MGELLGNKDGFFAIDKKKFYQACDLGMNAAVSYLVICNGSDKSNSKSSWSVNAIEKYTKISRSRAKEAVDKLIAEGIIIQIKGGTKPRYQVMNASKGKLNPKEVIWLSNGIVQSVIGELPALERIRQTQDVMILRLFVDLYLEQNLVDDGGIARYVYRTKYGRTPLGEQGIYRIYGFKSESCWMTWGEITKPHYNHDDEEKRAELFFQRIKILLELGLVNEIPYLCDSDTGEGEPLYPLDGGVGQIARDAACAMLSVYKSESEAEQVYDFQQVIPVPKHMTNAAVMGIYQLRHKPHTKLTGRWFVESSKQREEAFTLYRKLYADATKSTESAPF